MGFANINLSSILSSAAFTNQLNVILRLAEDRLREAIWKNVYMAYTPKEEDPRWHRTYQLYNSVTSSFKIIGDSVEIKVFCDPNKMHHVSIIDGEPTYVPPLINYGFVWPGWEGEDPDYFHNRPESKYLEDAMQQIQKDLQESAVQAVVMAFNSNRYR